MGAFFPLPEPEASSIITIPSVNKTLIDEVSSTVMYIGKAVPGTLESAASWQIQRLTSSGNDLVVEFASSGTFTEVWNDRASLSYS